MSAAEIHRELCVVYHQNVMSEGTVRQWCIFVQRWASEQMFTMKSEVVPKHINVPPEGAADCCVCRPSAQT
jgi:hypothetical protein